MQLSVLVSVEVDATGSDDNPATVSIALGILVASLGLTLVSDDEVIAQDVAVVPVQVNLVEVGVLPYELVDALQMS